MKIGKLNLKNEEKLSRVLESLKEESSEEQIVAAYDRLGGLITQGEDKVKTGCFYNFKEKKMIENPVVVLEFRDTEGDLFEVKEGEEGPIQVKVAKVKTKSKKKVKKEVKE